MSFTFKLANWTVEMDWQGLTVTPPEPASTLRCESQPVEPAELSAGEPPALETGETQVWA